MDTTDRLPLDEGAALSGVVLAGGRSRRMGGVHKALLPFRGEKIIHRQLRELKKICSEIILVTNEPRTFLPLVDSEIRIITDFYPDKGPLGGIHAALSLSSHSNVWIVACDMPFVSSMAAQALLAVKTERGAEAAVPYINDKMYPFHSIYDKSCVEQIPVLFGRGRFRVGGFVEAIRCERVEQAEFVRRGIDPRFVLNLNTPEQYESLLALETQEAVDRRRGNCNEKEEKAGHPS